MFMLISYLMIFQFHCWRCGEVFCTRCISTNTGLPGHHSRRAVPVCKPCFKMLRHSPSIDFPPSWSCVKEGFLFLQEFCSVSWTVKNEKENFADVMRKKIVMLWIQEVFESFQWTSIDRQIFPMLLSYVLFIRLSMRCLWKWVHLGSLVLELFFLWCALHRSQPVRIVMCHSALLCLR